MKFNLFRKQETTPVGEQPFDLDRVLELVDDGVHERVADFRQSVLTGGGRFTPDDNRLVEELTEEVAAVATERGMMVTDEDRDAIDRYIRSREELQEAA